MMKTMLRITVGITLCSLIAFAVFYAFVIPYGLWDFRPRPNLAAEIAYQAGARVVDWYTVAPRWTSRLMKRLTAIDNVEGIRNDGIWIIPWTVVYGAAIYAAYRLAGRKSIQPSGRLCEN
jgi:hypothetical protein